VKINGVKMLCDAGIVDVAETGWQVWNIDLSQAGNVGSVRSLISGIEGTGAKGTLYIDDVRLYSKTPQVIMPVPPDQASLVARYTFDGNFRDSAGSHHGTVFGDARIATDPVRGQVLMTDGNGDGVDVPYSLDLHPAAFTLSVWAYADPAGTNYRSPLTSRDDTPQRGYILYLAPTNIWQFWTGTGTTWHQTVGPAAQLGEWTHLGATFDNGLKTLYVNGRQVVQNTGTLVPNTKQPFRIGAGSSEKTAGEFFWRGFIDDVRLYKQALSAAEIASLAGLTKPMAIPF